ncbi:MAG: hypothetical protein COB85_07925, partial [Bacteroidetes bacterium]
MNKAPVSIGSEYTSSDEDQHNLAIAATNNVKARKYWKRKLSGALTKTTIPYEGERIKDNKAVFEDIEYKLSPLLSTELFRLSNHSNNRLHLILVAGLNALLHKYSSEDSSDIIIGVPIHKQDEVGELVNTVLPIRNQVESGTTFKQLLLKIRQTYIEAIDYQNFPIQLLPNELEITDADYGFPLFDICILLKNIHNIKYLEGVSHSITMSFQRTGEFMDLSIRYDTSRYLKSNIHRIANQFEQLLTSALEDVSRRIGDLIMITDKEKKQLLHDFNNTKSDYLKEIP